MAKIPANILRMALDAIDEPVAAVGKAVSDMPETAARALDDMAGAADDWGWKGGKPGEITGGEYMKLFSKAQKKADSDRAAYESAGGLDDDFSDTYYKIISRNMIDTDNKVINQLSRNPRTAYLANEYDIDTIMDDFETLENAGIPREWTGKVLPKMRSLLDSRYDQLNSFEVADVSNAMRSMTNAQRDTFISLLPEWEGSIEDLAVVARSLA